MIRVLCPDAVPFLNKRTSTIHLPTKVRLRKMGTYWTIYSLTRGMLEAISEPIVKEFLASNEQETILFSMFEIMKTKKGVQIKNLEPEVLYNLLMCLEYFSKPVPHWIKKTFQRMEEFMSDAYPEHKDTLEQR